MELRIGSLYESLYRAKHALVRLKELSEEEVGILYLASWSQQGYWRLFSQPKDRRLAHSVFLGRLARARTRKRRRLPKPPIEDVGIYEIKVNEEIHLARIRVNAQGHEVELERVGLRRNDGSYLRLPNLVTVLPIEQFRRLQRSAYEWRRA